MQSINSLLDRFRRNRFEPSVDPAEKIPASPGTYILCLRRDSQLPSIGIKPTYTTFEGLDVIYTGISKDSLRRRDYRKHFTGNNAGQSTLRKSVGVLFGYGQIPRDKTTLSNKTKFCPEDEQRLTEWMSDNLVMFYLVHPNFRQIEGKLINHFNSPLNLRNNHSSVNFEFRKQLSQRRRNRA